MQNVFPRSGPGPDVPQPTADHVTHHRQAQAGSANSVLIEPVLRPHYVRGTALLVDVLPLPSLARTGLVFDGETLDTGVCHMAFFHDPDGNALMLHRRYAPFHDGRLP
jgi:hypothetical protein